MTTIEKKVNNIWGNTALSDIIISGMETAIYRQEKTLELNKIIIFPIKVIGELEMNIKKLKCSKNLYDLLYEIEHLIPAEEIEYIRVNRQYTPLDMEITSATHGYEELIYHHFMIEITSLKSNEELMKDVVNAAEDSYYLRGFEYIVYIVAKDNYREVHLLINNISLRGEKLSKRAEYQEEFVNILKKFL